MPIIPYKLLQSALASSENEYLVPKSLLEFMLKEIVKHIDIDEVAYLRQNPDVAASVRKGQWVSAREHFVTTGYFEGRSGVGLAVSEPWYLKMNPDVANAVNDGIFGSGESHYNMTGMLEWRAPNKAALSAFESWRVAIYKNATTQKLNATVEPVVVA